MLRRSLHDIGQGVNQALEDAVELAQAIQQGGLTEDSLRAYEAKRIPRIREVMAASMVSFCLDGARLALQTPHHGLVCYVSLYTSG